MKLNKKQKSLFLFLLVLGNALTALLTFPSPSGRKNGRLEPVRRPLYVNLRVKASLKAELDPSSPVVLAGVQSKRIVTQAFVLKEYKSAGFPSELTGGQISNGQTTREFLVSMPKDQAHKALGAESFIIYPRGVVPPRKKRSSYEIVF